MRHPAGHRVNHRPMTAAHPEDTAHARPMLEEARRQARDAAARAGVDVDVISDLTALEAVEQLINRTWENPTSEISLGVLRAFTASGHLVNGAYREDTLVGACVAFVSASKDGHLHSHLAAVSPDQRAKGIGFALKLHQRAWAMDRGIALVSWTFDPLVRRNARLNIARLGASPVQYLPDFYGTREDALNASQPTDRVLARWALDTPKTRLACSRGTAAMQAAELTQNGGRVLVAPGRWGEPVTASDNGEPTVLVGLPEDITALRRERPEIAEMWRLAVRSSLGEALDGGLPVVGFTEQGHYVIDRTGAVRDPQAEVVR
jgi:predicted GNAT superfamily acetyltransferase